MTATAIILPGRWQVQRTEKKPGEIELIGGGAIARRQDIKRASAGEVGGVR